MEDKQEILHLKNNLDAYKHLNRDLSKKVQELKLYLNQQIQMLEATRNELMEERFFSSVITNLNECIVTTDLEMSIPDAYDPDKYLDNEEGEQAGPSSRVNPRTSKLNELNKLCKINAKNQEQYLYTIYENQKSLSTISIDDRNESTEERNESTEERNDSLRRSLRISTPYTSTCPEFQDFQNITYIPTQTSTSPIIRRDTNNLTCSINSSTASSFNINQDTPRKSHKRDSLGRRLSNSEDELPRKKLSIDLSAVSLTEQQLQEYLDTFNNNDNYEDDNESLFSSPSTSSSKVSAVTSKDDTAVTKKRKPRTKPEPLKRKSNGRPKRKIALNVSLAEKSCRTKLRRSK